MGLFRLVARVGCWRGGAIRLLEEWSPRLRAYRTRLTDPLALFAFTRGRGPARDQPWLGRRVRTIGDFRAGAAMAAAARRRGCACATATVAWSPATTRRPNRPTARSAGISARRTPPNTIATGFISRASPPRTPPRARRRNAAAPTASARRAIMAGAVPATAPARARR